MALTICISHLEFANTCAHALIKSKVRKTILNKMLYNADKGSK